MAHVRSASAAMDKQQDAGKSVKPSRSSNSRGPARTAVRTKVVVRRLPANLPEPIFWKSVEAWVTDETTLWKVYYPGKIKQRLNKENVPSRAYVVFKTPDQLALFSRDFDGHIFRDKQGHESRAIVEYAPYQKAVTERSKVDARQGTIEEDEDYISFLNSLQSATQADGVYGADRIGNGPPETVNERIPLIEALLAEKAAASEKLSGRRAPTVETGAPSRKIIKEATGPPVPRGKEYKQGAQSPLPSSDQSGPKAPPMRPTPAQPEKTVAGPSRSHQSRPSTDTAEPRELPARRPVVAGQMRQFEAALNAVNPGQRSRGSKRKEGGQKEGAEPGDVKESRQANASSDPRESREDNERADNKVPREPKEPRTPRAPREPRDARGSKRPRERKHGNDVTASKEQAESKTEERAGLQHIDDQEARVEPPRPQYGNDDIGPAVRPERNRARGQDRGRRENLAGAPAQTEALPLPGLIRIISRTDKPPSETVGVSAPNVLAPPTMTTPLDSRSDGLGPPSDGRPRRQFTAIAETAGDRGRRGRGRPGRGGGGGRGRQQATTFGSVGGPAPTS